MRDRLAIVIAGLSLAISVLSAMTAVQAGRERIERSRERVDTSCGRQAGRANKAVCFAVDWRESWEPTGTEWKGSN